MNQSSSSSKKSHNQKSVTSAWQEKQKMQQTKSRNPFKDLKNGVNGSDSFSKGSSVSSIEGPKGCLRFFLSHSSSSKTHSSSSCCNNNGKQRRPSRGKPILSPKSAPNTRPVKESSLKGSIFRKPISRKFEKVERNPCKSNKPSFGNVNKFSSLNSSGSFENKVKRGCGEVKQVVVDKVSDFDAFNFTPLSKMVTPPGLNLGVNGNALVDDGGDEKSNCDIKSTSSDTKTPPIQASVSPEMQCGSSIVSETVKTITPVCYGAGYVVSGVVDRRKCRPRGLLTVGEAKPLDCFDSDEDSEKENDDPELVDDSSVSMLPLPSMRWLLSPCNEANEDQKESPQEGSCQFRRLEDSTVCNFSASPLSGNDAFSPDLLNNSAYGGTSTASARRKTKSSSLASTSRGFKGPSLFDNTGTAVLCLGKEVKNCYGFDEEKSPFSAGSGGSGNVIQTPQSDSSTDRRVGICWLNAHDGRKSHNFDSELDSGVEPRLVDGSSLKNHASLWDLTRSSFQFDCLTTPSNSIDLSHVQKVLDDRTSWFSTSTLGNVSQSQMRISWREGLVSRIFEMDEFDCCRCLSDEEDDVYTSNCDDDRSKSKYSPCRNIPTVNVQPSTNFCRCTMFKEGNLEVDGRTIKEKESQVPCSCAESISTDGGLIRSEDSDWTLCYKNQLFQL